MLTLSQATDKKESNRRMFSIAKEFDDVKGIIDEKSNYSRFICEAILEKHERENNPFSIENQLKGLITQLTQSNQLQHLLLSGLLPGSIPAVIPFNAPHVGTQTLNETMVAQGANPIPPSEAHIQQQTNTKEISATVESASSKETINSSKDDTIKGAELSNQARIASSSATIRLARSFNNRSRGQKDQQNSSLQE